MSAWLKVCLYLSTAFVLFVLIAPTLVIVPISFTGRESLAFPPVGVSWRWYANFFSNEAWLASLLTSLQVATGAAVLATCAGTAAGLGISRLGRRAGGLLRGLLISPMIIPSIVIAIGVYAVFLDAHLTGTYIGFVLAHAMVAVPFVVIAVSANLAVYDTRLETAASSLGASRWVIFRTVTLPLILPGVLSGFLFAFVASFDEVIISLFISDPHMTTLPVRIFNSMTRDADPTVAAVGTMIFVGTTLVIGIGLYAGMKKK